MSLHEDGVVPVSVPHSSPDHPHREAAQRTARRFIAGLHSRSPDGGVNVVGAGQAYGGLTMEIRVGYCSVGKGQRPNEDRFRILGNCWIEPAQRPV
jgi:hypothetical protein